jgi:hypothetical protein
VDELTVSLLLELVESGCLFVRTKVAGQIKPYIIIDNFIAKDCKKKQLRHHTLDEEL